MNIFEVLGIVVANGFITTLFYLKLYFGQCLIGIILVLAGIIEYKEKKFLAVADERKVV